MLPKIPILRLPDSLDIPLPKYQDGIGTTMTLAAAISNPIKIAPGDFATVPTGFQCALPLGIEAQIRSLTHFSEAMPIIVLNAPVTIDASDHNPIFVTLKNMGHNSVLIRRGQPIATLVFSPVLRILWDEIKQPEKPKPEPAVLITDETTAESIATVIEKSPEPTPSVPPVPAMEEFSQSEIKRMQEEADKALDSIGEIEYQNIANGHSDEAFLEPPAQKETDTDHPHDSIPSVSPFIPPDVAEIAQETTVPPEAVGPAVEENAIQDEIRDEEIPVAPVVPPTIPADVTEEASVESSIEALTVPNERQTEEITDNVPAVSPVHTIEGITEETSLEPSFPSIKEAEGTVGNTSNNLPTETEPVIIDAPVAPPVIPPTEPLVLPSEDEEKHD